VDFIPKPGGEDAGSPEALRELLAEKVRIVRSLRRANLRPVPPAASVSASARRRAPATGQPAGQTSAAGQALRVIAIGASTGGPPALQHILGTLPPDFPAALVIAQHMPERFTTAFAARLDRGSALEVLEAQDGDVLAAGRALLAPGGRQMTVSLAGGVARARVLPPAAGDTYIPSVDDLFRSVAALSGDRAMGLVLTGMGRDGREGIVTLKQAGGVTVAESEATAIVHGMPKEAADTGCVDRVLPLEEISEALVAFALKGRLPTSRGR
jgi:two-component system chemotaxis response regulator CheB